MSEGGEGPTAAARKLDVPCGESSDRTRGGAGGRGTKAAYRKRKLGGKRGSRLSYNSIAQTVQLTSLFCVSTGPITPSIYQAIFGVS